jgi:hypothetical protein
MHGIVIGLFFNRYEFSEPLEKFNNRLKTLPKGQPKNSHKMQASVVKAIGAFLCSNKHYFFLRCSLYDCQF